jgi:hypothetical protein
VLLLPHNSLVVEQLTANSRQDEPLSYRYEIIDELFFIGNVQ